jgi:hypothetical protein
MTRTVGELCGGWWPVKSTSRVCGGGAFSVKDPSDGSSAHGPRSGKGNEPPSLFTTCLNHFSHVYQRAFWPRIYMEE